jgi:hypothetical protein
MKILPQEDAELANLIIILIGTALQRTSSNRGPDKITRNWLVDEIKKCTPNNYSTARILMILSRLVEWGVVKSEERESYDLFQAGDLAYNLINDPRLSVFYQLIIFANINQQVLPNKSTYQYEILAARHDSFQNAAKWATSVEKIQSDPQYTSTGVAIIVAAVKVIRSYWEAHPGLRPLPVRMDFLVPLIQMKLYSKYPLLNPLVIQAFVEHAAVQKCLQIEDLEVDSCQTTKAFKVTAIPKDTNEIHPITVVMVNAMLRQGSLAT